MAFIIIYYLIIKRYFLQKKISSNLYMEVPNTDPKDAYILVDYKLNAILGVFSTFDKVREAKSGVVKRDTDMIKIRIEKEITLDKLTQERKQYLVGKLNTIDLIYSDYEKRWETSYIDFDDVAPLNRYGWYRMKMDMFRLDKTMFGPIVMLPPPKV